MSSIEQRLCDVIERVRAGPAISDGNFDRFLGNWLNYTNGQGNPLPRYDLTPNEPISTDFVKFHGLVLLKSVWLASDQVEVMPWTIRIEPNFRINDLHEPMRLLREAGVYCLATKPAQFWVKGQHDSDGLLLTNEIWFFTESDMVLGAAMFAQYGG